MAVLPRDAATVILLRDRNGSGGGGMEVLMVHRHPKSDFVPGSYVFPGGAMEKEDFTPGMGVLCAGRTCEAAYQALANAASPAKALGAWVTAIRETFEEVGLLMAYRGDGTLFCASDNEELHRFGDYRKALRDGSLGFYEFLVRESLTLAADRLHYFSHWITPEAAPIRYDTRFFIGRAPAGQDAVHDGVELTKHRWLTPREALDAYESGAFDMVVPTVMTLEELDGYATVDDAILSTARKEIPSHCIRVDVDEKEGITIYAPDGRVFKRIPPSVR